MRLGLSAVSFRDCLRPGRELQIAEAARRAGFDFLEGMFSVRRPPAAVGADTTTLASLDFGRVSFFDPRAEVRRLAHAAADALVAGAAAHGIALVSFSPGHAAGGMPPDLDGPSTELRRLCGEAAARGIRLCIENVPGHATQARAALEAVVAAVPGLGVCLDVANALADPPLDAWFASFGPRIAKLHLGDGAFGGGRFIPAPPGTGAVCWTAVRAGLAELPADICVVAELLGGPPGAEEDFVAQGGARLRALLAA